MSLSGTRRSVPYLTLDSNAVSLDVRQHPQQALITPEAKEKVRKQVDPPPIVQLKVDGIPEASQNNWLVNPFLFMTALLVQPHPESGTYRAVTGNQIIGQNVSSLHRLKDIDNRDGGFFVFGDLSIRNAGTYRLQFNLFDYDKEGGNVVFVQSVVSDEFEVVPSKQFRGMMESTHLSRTFSDQGVRLRLRKEPRTLSGKRTFGGSPPESETSSQQYSIYGSSMSSDRNSAYETPSFKRQRSDSDYGSHTYNPSPLSAEPLSHYGTMLQTNNHTPSEVQQSSQFEPTPSYDGTMGQRAYHTVPVWPRLQQGPVSAPVIGSSDPFLHVQRQAYSGGYSHLQSQQYHSRASIDGYSAFAGYQAPSSMPDSGLVSPEQQGYLSSNLQHSAGSMNGSAAPAQEPRQTQHPQDPYTPAGIRSVPLNQPLQNHQSNPSTQQGLSSFEDRSQTGSLRYGQLPYPDQANPLQRVQHDSFQHSSGSMPSSSLPLDSGLLNRSFAPAYQTQQQEVDYSTSTGQGLPDYGSGQPQPYSESHLLSNHSQ